MDQHDGYVRKDAHEQRAMSDVAVAVDRLCSETTYLEKM